MPESNQTLHLTSGLEDKQGLEEELNDIKKQQANSNYDVFYTTNNRVSLSQQHSKRESSTSDKMRLKETTKS